MTDNLILHRVALHQCFLIVLVVDLGMLEIRAYYVPVPGINHNEEQHLWRRSGRKVPAIDAAHFFPVTVAHYKLHNYTYAY